MASLTLAIRLFFRCRLIYTDVERIPAVSLKNKNKSYQIYAQKNVVSFAHGVSRIVTGAVVMLPCLLNKNIYYEHSGHYLSVSICKIIQDAQLSQRDRDAGCVIVFAKSRTLELGDNILRT